jgi:hypothetical protein
MPKKGTNVDKRKPKEGNRDVPRRDLKKEGKKEEERDDYSAKRSAECHRCRSDREQPAAINKLLCLSQAAGSIADSREGCGSLHI